MIFLIFHLVFYKIRPFVPQTAFLISRLFGASSYFPSFFGITRHYWGALFSTFHSFWLPVCRWFSVCGDAAVLLPSSQTLKHCGNFISLIVSSLRTSTPQTVTIVSVFARWDAQQERLLFSFSATLELIPATAAVLVRLPPAHTRAATLILIGSGVHARADLWIHLCWNMSTFVAFVPHINDLTGDSTQRTLGGTQKTRRADRSRY